MAAAIWEEPLDLAACPTAPPSSPTEHHAQLILPAYAQLPSNGHGSANILMAGLTPPVNAVTSVRPEIKTELPSAILVVDKTEPTVPVSSNGLPRANGHAAAETDSLPIDAVPKLEPEVKAEAPSDTPVADAPNGATSMDSKELPPPKDRAAPETTPPPAPPPPSTASSPAIPTPLPPRRKLRSRASRLDLELSRLPTSPPRIEGDRRMPPEVLREDDWRQERLVWSRVRPRYRRDRYFWSDDEQEPWYVDEEYVSGGIGDDACDGKCGVEGMMWDGVGSA
nr:hypothetical protein B0A51_12414 [Rachicladosporium sp. CCFEE 5018]